jgi:hypothetical protein
MVNPVCQFHHFAGKISGARRKFRPFFIAKMPGKAKIKEFFPNMMDGKNIE